MFILSSILYRYNHQKRFKSLCKKFGPTVKISEGAIIADSTTFEGANKVYGKAFVKAEVGYGTYIQENSNIRGKVGRFCSIGVDVKTVCWTHPYKEPFVSTSPMFFSLLKQTGTTFATEQTFEEMVEPPVIGNDVWIGNGAFIVGKVHISDGAVVLAHAVVTKDVPPYAIVGGVPAKIIGYRFTPETIDQLLEIKWWNKPIEWLKENWRLLNDMNKFKEYISDESK